MQVISKHNISSAKKQMSTLQTGKAEAVFALQNIQRTCNHDSMLRNLLSLPISGSTGLHQLPAWPHTSRTDAVYEGPESQQAGRYPTLLHSVGVRQRGPQSSNAPAVTYATRLHMIPQDELRAPQIWKLTNVAKLVARTHSGCVAALRHGKCMGPCTLPQGINGRGGHFISVNLTDHLQIHRAGFFSICTLLYLQVSYFLQQRCHLLQDYQWAFFKASGGEITLWNPALFKSKRTFDIWLGIIIKHTSGPKPGLGKLLYSFPEG